MPSALPGRDAHAVQSWWNPDNLLQSPSYSTISHKSDPTYSHPFPPRRQDVGNIHSWWKPECLLQNRPHSTSTQESSIGDAPASAILHGPKSPSHSHRHSNHAGFRGVERADKSRSPPPRTAQPAVKSVGSSRTQRNAFKHIVGSQDSPPARRTRGDSVVLKDEAFIRRNMHVPTQEDYPSVNALVFKQPQNTINNLVQQNTLEQASIGSGRRGFKSTLGSPLLGIEAVEGQGTSKVLRLDSS